MELRAALNRNFTRLTIALAVTVASGAAYAILARPERDPDQLWHQVQQDLKAGKLDRAALPDVATEELRELVRLRDRLVQEFGDSEVAGSLRSCPWCPIGSRHEHIHG